VGLTIKNPSLIVESEPQSKDISVEFAEKAGLLGNEEKNNYKSTIQSASMKVLDYLGVDQGFHFILHQTFPRHSGLGSGTQLSLAVGALIANFNGITIESSLLGQIVGRGGTSGIGVASFDQGGFIVDGGHTKSEKNQFLPSSASKASPPPILARYDFPDDWNILLVIPQLHENVSGSKEINIFQEYCPLPLTEVQQLSHIILMKMMPAVLEADLDSFGEAVNMVQNVAFKKVENKLQNPILKDLMESLRTAGATGAGMSSFGPTIFAVTDKNPDKLIKAAKETLKDLKTEFIITKAQNTGANI
jgi:beta-ribofuranosylaminobenzene 5'-phosphate synthase